MFSICIPNYNYERYLGFAFDSIAAQSYSDWEVLLADNCSTDGSVPLTKNFKAQHPDKVYYKVNKANLGFAGNLDAVATMASRDYMIMLSSDDVVMPDALKTYKQLVDLLPGTQTFVLSSAEEVIDHQGKHLRWHKAQSFSKPLWQANDIDATLSQQLGHTVYKVAAHQMLQRCLQHMANPFNFLTTCYPQSLYEKVGGYGGGRLMNPDKWFHWKLLGQADYVYFVDTPLFQYRWHAANQTAQQKKAGHLKYLVDEYRNIIELGPDMLRKAGLERKQLHQAFINNDIMRHGLGEMSKAGWLKAYRVLHFGLGVFPGRVLRHKWFLPFIALLATGPLAQPLARILSK